MAYIVNKSDNTVVATIPDGSIDNTSTSISLPGKGYNNYGEILAENWIKMTEHFANTVAPAKPLRGQCWFDVSTNSMKVNLSNNPNSPDWVVIGKAIVLGSQPTDFDQGTFWYDSTNNVLNISTDGSTFTSLQTVLVGTTLPNTSSVDTGTLFFDTSNNEFRVLTPNYKGSGSAGWDILHTKYSATEPVNLNDGDLWFDSTTKQYKSYSDAVGTNAAGFDTLGPIMPKNINHDRTEIVGISVSGNPVVVWMVDGEPMAVWSTLQFANPGGTQSGIDFSDFPSILEKGLNMTTAQDGSSNDPLFNGTAASANMADLAERYETDAPGEVGDLMQLGGEKEITKTTLENDMSVFGVISKNPAFRMNAGAGSNQTHPYVALSGRVPCKVTGKVKKGQRLVSSSIPGVAMAIDDTKVSENYVSVFGRSLVDDDGEDIRLIEVVVGVK